MSAEIQKVKTLLNSQVPLVMGIVNCSPESFSDESVAASVEEASAKIRTLSDEGADIVDIGGESTSPGSTPVGGADEIERIERVVAWAAPEHFVSIDTYRADTARRCLELGASMINDVSALRADTEMAGVVASYRAYVVLMYAKDGPLPHATIRPQQYADVVATARDFLAERIDFACRAGIDTKRIVLDPGMGMFLSSDPQYSYEMLSRYHELTRHFKDFPVLVGTSRKGFLGGSVTDRDPVSQLTAVLAVERGAAIVRTHNVRMAKDFLKVHERCKPFR